MPALQYFTSHTEKMRCPLPRFRDFRLTPNRKITDALCALVFALREKRNLGARRIQSELKRLHDTGVSLATIHKILINQNTQLIKKLRRKKKFIRYQRPIPGDRIQISIYSY